MHTQSKSYDLIIIGAGPAGLSCAIEADNAGLSYLVIDKGGIVDGIRRFQRDMFFFSTPELLEIGKVPFVVCTTRPTAHDCVNYYRRVAEHHHLKCAFYESVLSSTKQDDGFLLKTAKGNEYQSKYIVVATGYYDSPNPLIVPGEHLGHVSHYYNDPLPFYAQDVLIVGGKNSAVEAALDLWRHGARVTVVHRGEKLSSGVKYWILPDFENRVADGSIKLMLSTEVKEFLADCTLVRHADGTTEKLETHFAFILIGYRPDVSFLKSLGISVDPDSLAPKYNPETMETNIHNLFVAGGLVGGRFNNKVFIENGRGHGKLIVDAIKGR